MLYIKHVFCFIVMSDLSGNPFAALFTNISQAQEYIVSQSKSDQDTQNIIPNDQPNQGKY